MVMTQAGARRLALFIAPLLLSLAAIPGSAGPRAQAAPAPLPHLAAILQASPVSAAPGQTITLIGAYFAAPNGAVTPTVTAVFVDANGNRTTVGQATPSSAGGGFNLPVIVPSTAAVGPAQFFATDTAGNTGTTLFDVRPASTAIAVVPNSAIPGSAVAISGTGFAVNQPIRLTFSQPALASVLSSGTVTSTNAGTFSAVVLIPGNASAGTSSLLAQDGDSNAAATQFTVVRHGSPMLGVTPTTGMPNQTVTITGANFAANEPATVTLSQNGHTLATVASLTTTVSGAFTATTIVPTAVVSGAITLSAIDNSLNTAVATLPITGAYNVENGPSTFYFAEGYTGQLSTNGRASFTETLSILNANPFTATTVITYLIQDASPVVVTRSIPPSTTLREPVNSDIGPDKTVAALVSSPSQITVERIIRRVGAHGAVLDGNSSLGNASLGTTFYFAEGYTGISFQEYLTVANPGNTAAHVTIYFAPQAGSSEGAPTVRFVVPANSRATRNVRRDVLTVSNKSVGMIVTSDQPIMAERVLYFGDGTGSAKYGSTAKAGIQTLANQYYFAYGSAGGSGLAQRKGDQSYVTILNPDLTTTRATVVAQFYTASGHLLGATSVDVAPRTRQTINANAIVGNTSSIYATVLTSASPFVAEKPQYFGGDPNSGAHPGVAPSGTPGGIKSVSFPDLSLTSALGEPQQQTVFLYNPTANPVTVAATYVSAGASKIVSYTLAPSTVTTVNVNGDAASLGAGVLGATFTVASNGVGDAFVAADIANTADGRSYTGTQGFAR